MGNSVSNHDTLLCELPEFGVAVEHSSTEGTYLDWETNERCWVMSDKKFWAAPNPDPAPEQAVWRRQLAPGVIVSWPSYVSVMRPPAQGGRQSGVYFRTTSRGGRPAGYKLLGSPSANLRGQILKQISRGTVELGLWYYLPMAWVELRDPPFFGFQHRSANQLLVGCELAVTFVMYGTKSTERDISVSPKHHPALTLRVTFEDERVEAPLVVDVGVRPRGGTQDLLIQTLKNATRWTPVLTFKSLLTIIDDAWYKNARSHPRHWLTLAVGTDR